MTAAVTTAKPAVLDWDNLAEPIPVELPTPVEGVPDRTPTGLNICPICELEIVREPGARGRAPKYHADCRPSNRTGTVKAGVARGSSKAEKEADEAVGALRSQILKLCMLVAVADQYSAFCVMVSLPDIMENLRGVLIRYEWLRKELLAVKGGGSVFALILSLLTLVIPLSARYGLIPSKKIAQMMLQLPYALHSLHKKMEQGEMAMTDLIERQMEEHEERKKKATANVEPDSDN